MQPHHHRINHTPMYRMSIMSFPDYKHLLQKKTTVREIQIYIF